MRLSILAKIIILSIISATGLSFLLLGCILPNAYWPLFILLFYVFLPIPILIASSCNRGGDSTALNELAIFISAILFVSTFGLPIVLYLKGCIQSLGFVFALIGKYSFDQYWNRVHTIISSPKRWISLIGLKMFVNSFLMVRLTGRETKFGVPPLRSCDSSVTDSLSSSTTRWWLYSPRGLPDFVS